MSAEPVEPPRRGAFAEASPQEIRAALIPEEQLEFDAAWRTAMTEATATLDLSGVFETLDNWRLHAAITKDLGHRGYRELLARAENTLRTGETPPGTVPWSELKVELGL